MVLISATELSSLSTLSVNSLYFKPLPKLTGSSDFPPVVVVSVVDLGKVSQKSSTDAPFSWYWGLLSSAEVTILSEPVYNGNTPVDTMVPKEEIAFKGV
ncbi:hypothetical protein HanHA300_Chr11g0403581 [Helianthus annuus]|nr:hypothetical protein HanHA300_Chr11g0403581 [Helianthus annuus]KAJ0517595.1 hypothetical protein HanHA89_Chr11g0427171 [Helianthus annuus]KAJ0685608.1 hypothetical protein HanLR1_Chr11g0404641 [Helianthus annuus]KAJ0689495.1 hypothetical protein HanOQP8_Chr11g0406391 [Helianthus annuus]